MWACFTMPNYTRERWNDIFRSNRASQEESDSNHFSFLFPIPYIRKAGQWTDRFVKNGRQISVRPVPPKVIPNIPVERDRNGLFHISDEISGIFGIMANTCGLHLLVHCGMASEAMESFPLFFYFYQLGRYYRKDILSHGTCSKVNGSVVTAWHFHKFDS